MESRAFVSNGAEQRNKAAMSDIGKDRRGQSFPRVSGLPWPGRTLAILIEPTPRTESADISRTSTTWIDQTGGFVASLAHPRPFPKWRFHELATRRRLTVAARMFLRRTRTGGIAVCFCRGYRFAVGSSVGQEVPCLMAGRGTCEITISLEPVKRGFPGASQ